MGLDDHAASAYGFPGHALKLYGRGAISGLTATTVPGTHSPLPEAPCKYTICPEARAMVWDS